MRACGLIALLPLLGAAQTPATALIAQGVLLERDSPALEGQFSIRGADNQVFRYRYDTHTYVVRDSRLSNVPALNPGETVEVISDSQPGSLVRYARDIHVINESPAPPRVRTTPVNHLVAGIDPIDRYFSALPMGNLTFSGVVYRVNGDRVVLRTRAGDQPILLRRDTKYVEDGETVGSASLKPNMRVFVRAGRDLWDQVEAYQVVWGGILQPQ